jgi:hypothetical protein
MVLPSRWRGCCLALIIAIVSCSSAWAGPRLSKKEVIQIANRKARHDLHYDLRDFEIYFVRYFRDEDKWYVNYRSREHPEGHGWFTVEIRDGTREATVSLP